MFAVSFEDLKRANVASALAWHAGERIEYAVHPGDFFEVDALVEREVLSETGELVRSMIEVVVSRSQVDKAQFGKDRIRVEMPRGSGKTVEFRVVDDVEGRGDHDATFYRLRAVR